MAACKSLPFTVKDGTTARELLLYHQSIGLLEKEFAAEKDLNKQREKALQIADSYKKVNDYPNAEKWYRQCVDLNGGEKPLFELGLMQKQQEKYTEAIKTFEQYQRLTGSGFEGRKQANQCRDALDWKKAYSRISLQNMAALNSAFADYAAEKYKNNQWVFTSTRGGAAAVKENQLGGSTADLFIANGTTITELGAPVNTAGFESSATFSADYKEMYFVRCRIDEKSNQFCHLYYTAYNNEHWNEPVKLELFPDTVNVYDPHLSRDGKFLFVAADQPDNFGKTDLYMLAKTDSGWGVPQNLGGGINTPGSERFPWLDEKGLLYYSSDGLPGMGGLDIFKASRSKSGFKEPQNLRAPFNSGADDFAYRIEKYRPATADDTILQAGYLSSNRPGGKGQDDLYRFEEKWINVFVLRGTTVEKQYENPENADSRVLGLQPLPKAKIELKATDNTVLATTVSDTAGNFTFKLEAETDYKLSAIKNGYFSAGGSASTKGRRHPDSTFINVYVEIELEKIFPQKEIVIPNIYYDYDKATLRPESKAVLDSILIFFKDNPDLTIEIGSHTDSRGSDAYNLKLSQARAQSVVDYLIEKGVATEKLQAKGYGETKPVNGCVNGAKCSEEEFQKNRRTTFRVLSAKLNLESIEPEDIRVDPKKEE